MGIFRLYTGSDGQSHIEEQTLGSHPALTQQRATAHIEFRELPPGTFMDWHPAPRRQYVIVLAGQLEIGFKDGTVCRANPGMPHWQKTSLAQVIRREWSVPRRR